MSETSKSKMHQVPDSQPTGPGQPAMGGRFLQAGAGLRSVLGPGRLGLWLPLLFLVGTCVRVLILSSSLSLTSYYTQLCANCLSDPR